MPVLEPGRGKTRTGRLWTYVRDDRPEASADAPAVLFCGSDAGGERAAALYSLIGTAKLNGLDPEAYLRHVIERIADHPINRVEELLPWHVADTLLGNSKLELAA